MYIPEQFRVSDLRRLDWLAQHDAFGTLISIADGAPVASQLPVLYRRDGERVTLTGHWARPNPQWRTIENQRVLFILHGPHAYISPRWYTDPAGNVPTWNYATAHLYGGVRIMQEPSELQKVVAALAAFYEAGAAEPWRMGEGSANTQRLRGIVGFELLVDEVQLKFKLNQNHSAENIEGAVSGLAESTSDDSREVAALMRETLQARKP